MAAEMLPMPCLTASGGIADSPSPVGPVLRSVHSPADLRALDAAKLSQLATDIRAFLIASVARTGGHLGPNLGVVELTMAMHRVFDSPRDRVLFDTGHQAYVHKLLTGRLHEFGSLRQEGGLSGYPLRAESSHDVIENSHASTGLAYAAGIARAQALEGSDRHVVIVAGDGALTGGMAWEALNNLGAAPDLRVVVVLNDNGRSYAPTVGGLASNLAGLRSGQVAPNIFTSFGLAYHGPVDGHDVAAVERALRQAQAMGRPVVVHCVTEKGRGYAPAEADAAERMHAIGVINASTGVPPAAHSHTWTDVFGAELCEIAAERQDVVAITAAMPGPTGLAPFSRKYPDRFFDVGIAEQQAVTFAAGLAMGGLHPVIAIYSTFLSRAFDQLLMDVALHKLPVTIVTDRAGITGPDGPSHHGMWDTSILSVVPGLRLAAPRDPTRLRLMLRSAVRTPGPAVVRYPKASAGPDIEAVDRIGALDVLAAHGHDVLIVAVGVMARPCMEGAAELASHGVGVTVVSPDWVLPVDPALLKLAGRFETVVTVEDAARGVGGAITGACADARITATVRTLGLPAEFLGHGDRAALLAKAGLDAHGIKRAVLDQAAAGAPARTAARVVGWSPSCGKRYEEAGGALTVGDVRPLAPRAALAAYTCDRER
jgi:1-deoxy-D-xylulose-5-phosphate synthase